MSNKYIINILTIIFGLCIGIIIGFFSFKQYIYKGPDSNIIKEQIYTDFNGKKYKWKPNICICPISYSMNKLKDSTFICQEH